MQEFEIEKIASAEVQAFLRANEKADEHDLILRRRTMLGLSTAILADQISGRRKARLKLPAYYQAEGIVYPPSLNLEQSSSQKTAEIKLSKLLSSINKFDLAVDLTGGLGIDSYLFSQAFKKVVYVDADENILTIARHNHKILGVNNIEYFCCKAEEYLSNSSGQADAIYIDPSRRTEGNKKVKSLKECSPDITSILDLVLTKCDVLMVKAAPLLDLKSALNDISFVQAVLIVSVENDCKELLFLSKQGFTGEAQVETVNVVAGGAEVFDFTLHEEKTSTSQFASPGTFLYEPNASIMKGGAFKTIASRFNLLKLEVNTHLYTGNTLLSDFPGRAFKVLKTIDSNPKSARVAFVNQAANILVRNYPLSVSDIKSKLKLVEGGDNYLIATSAIGKKLLIVAERIK